MKRLFVIQLFLSIVTPFYCVAQEPIVIDAFAGPFPYLYEVVQGYTHANFEYPKNVDDILKYWQEDKQSAITREILTDTIIERLDSTTFSRLDKERRYISISHKNRCFVAKYKQDTLFWETMTNYYKPLKHYWKQDRVRMRNFYYVSMMCSDSQVHNDASEEVQWEFTKGLYRMVGTALPKFGESRKQLKPFKVIILEFKNGKLSPKYCRKGFNPKALPLYDEVGKYVADFAKEYGFSRIIFYYMYDG